MRSPSSCALIVKYNIGASTSLQTTHAGRRQFCRPAPRHATVCRAASKELGAPALAAAAAGLVANPICLWSEYTLKTTGSGLPPGPGGALGAAEGVSYLVRSPLLFCVMRLAHLVHALCRMCATYAFGRCMHMRTGAEQLCCCR